MDFLSPLWDAIGNYKILLEFIVVLGSLYIGSRVSGIGLGLVPAVGMVLLVFVFGLEPGSPPITVMLIIIAAVACASVMQATDAIDWMIQQAERLLRKHPKMITILGPISTWLLTVICGTGHVVYTILPIIADIAHRQGIRPERAVAASSIASQMGITASPVAAAVAAFLAMHADANSGITMGDILAVTMIGTLSGVLALSIWSTFRGKDLKDDEQYQKRLKDPEMHAYMFGDEETVLGKKIAKSAPISVALFILGLVIIVFLAQVKEARPMIGDKPAGMTVVIQIVLMAVAGIILLVTKVKSSKVIEGNVFRSGMVAVTIIFGIAWMSDTFFGSYRSEMEDITKNFVATAPTWTFAFVLFFVSVFINSQGAATILVMPIAFHLGIDPIVLLGIFPAVYGYFFIPNYPSDIAAMNFDRSGTTKIGKYLFNHSFMAPGLIGVTVACLVATVIAQYVIAPTLH